MKYTLGTAAKATNKAKSTISRDIKDGRLSAERNEDSSYSIDSSELIRVYGDEFDPNRSENTFPNDIEPPETPMETGGLQAEVKLLRERLVLIDLERSRERQQLSEQIDDLRHRLDIEGEERRKLTAILTDQRAKPEQDAGAVVKAEPPQAAATLWGRLRLLATGR